jgi:hypothetical protein
MDFGVQLDFSDGFARFIRVPPTVTPSTLRRFVINCVLTMNRERTLKPRSKRPVSNS